MNSGRSRAIAPGILIAIAVAVAVVAGAETPGGGQPPSAPEGADHLRSPYAKLPGPAATGLLPQEVDALTKGEGMALALAAEVNGYPGPRHVLDADAAGQLGLRPEQRTALTRVFDRMHALARAKGREILEREGELATRFRHHHIDEAGLTTALDRIGRLRAELRAIHLRAHLETEALLTPEQIARYETARGYDAARPQNPDAHPGHSH
jgi:Spy/CpxP family protein refolding chaperone